MAVLPAGSGVPLTQPPPMPDSAPLIQPSALNDVKVKPRNRKDAELLELDESSLKPGFHYRWVRCRSDEHIQSVTKHKLRGYELVTTDSGIRTVAQPDRRPDNVIAIGDLVLMACPIADHQARVDARHAHTEGLLHSTSAETKRMAKEKGVKIIEDL